MTQARFKIKKGDLVEVITGSHKGKRGAVTKVLLKDARVIVENINVVRRKVRLEQNSNGFVEKTLPISISNVAVVDPSTDKPGKVYIRVESDGTKIRCFRKTNKPV